VRVPHAVVTALALAAESAAPATVSTIRHTRLRRSAYTRRSIQLTAFLHILPLLSCIAAVLLAVKLSASVAL
jgi:hypothetical protein